jgi:hypothetical protein
VQDSEARKMGTVGRLGESKDIVEREIPKSGGVEIKMTQSRHVSRESNQLLIRGQGINEIWDSVNDGCCVFDTFESS